MGVSAVGHEFNGNEAKIRVHLKKHTHQNTEIHSFVCKTTLENAKVPSVVCDETVKKQLNLWVHKVDDDLKSVVDNPWPTQAFATLWYVSRARACK